MCDPYSCGKRLLQCVKIQILQSCDQMHIDNISAERHTVRIKIVNILHHVYIYIYVLLKEFHVDSNMAVLFSGCDELMGIFDFLVNMFHL